MLSQDYKLWNLLIKIKYFLTVIAPTKGIKIKHLILFDFMPLLSLFIFHISVVQSSAFLKSTGGGCTTEMV